MAKDRKKPTFTYDYPRPAVTVDIVLLTTEPEPCVLLIQRKRAPFAKMWAFPGGFVNEGETLLAAAHRELLEETGVVVRDLEQLYIAGDPGRDPRGWTMSIAFLGRIDALQVQAIAADDAAAVDWFELEKLPKLAFDHAMLLNRARTRIADRSA